MKLRYVCRRTEKIGNCHYVIEVAHFKELIEKIEQHEHDTHEEQKTRLEQK